uniref:protein-tyrosine-phosphatase n=1 Tax=Pyramimonas obovata TaxID=1411642 RepID=A0A7S0RVJ9_9CHLO|mmetsp:Transcript_7941/g.16227  ORF Transcript_7941/g.16227 Transcript_7941/m.16227 type:complete len:206 (+) Transcript_7941:120-737(+)|eukprot:CAMPEP_0118922848 /NCGR_PEP_ID=MMETSP1169-20130426/1624_1 /TAXON_ID=36882 /ORGANISM="Pyramimonas obovata, Strain CCMP722" /LENGTH=205 /DNA_ID=CAMNT_0006863775 /DNA_START=99 /DNA_END=716 /DNA_ORIENTATION=+
MFARRKPAQSEKLDFDDEALKLFKTLNIKPGELGGDYNYLDPVWRHPTSGGILYIGNQTAAQDLSVQAAHKITHIVNCTADMPNFHEGKAGKFYLRFDVSNHWRYLDSSDQSVVQFVTPLFQFVDTALERGHSVLVHCLAGAHRAGTTGVACLMHLTGAQADEATKLAQRCRRVVCPIGMLPQFLDGLERLQAKRSQRGIGSFNS